MDKKSIIHIINNNFVYFLIVIFTIISLINIKDYGHYPDGAIPQLNHLRIHTKAYVKLFGNDNNTPIPIKEAQNINDYAHKYYGLAGQYIFIPLEFIDTINESDPLFWQLRYFYIKLMFIIAAYLYLKVIREFTNNKLILILAILLFFLSPRIWANTTYNIKDGLFLSFFFFSFYSLYKYIKSPNYINLILFSVITGVAINIRMMALLIPAYFFVYLIIKFYKNFKFLLIQLLTLTIVTGTTLFIIWPTLWDNPIKLFIESFDHFKNYTAWNGTLIFNGNVVYGNQLPFTYIPIWILITSPISHVIAYILSVWAIFYTIYQSIKTKIVKISFIKNINNPVMISAYIISMSYLAILAFDSTLYGDWRHLYYIYPFLCILGMYGIYSLRKYYYKTYVVVCCLMFMSFVQTSIWLVKNHPHHYTYFNPLVKNWDTKWDRDIWGLSNFQAQKLLISKKHNSINLYNDVYSRVNYSMLSNDEKSKITLINEIDNSEYIIGIYRNIIGDYPVNYFDGFEEYDSVYVDGKKIATIFRRYETGNDSK